MTLKQMCKRQKKRVFPGKNALIFANWGKTDIIYLERNTRGAYGTVFRKAPWREPPPFFPKNFSIPDATDAPNPDTI